MYALMGVVGVLSGLWVAFPQYFLPMMIIVITIFMMPSCIRSILSLVLGDTLLRNKSIDTTSIPRFEHHKRRFNTYPPLFPNTWYHLLNSEELPRGTVKEIYALNTSFVLWRTLDGTVVCQEAYCLHLGANLAVGGRVDNQCLVCPFHCWKYDSNGSVVDIPYIPNYKHPQDACPGCVTVKKQLRTFPTVEWCDMICIYYSADPSPIVNESPLSTSTSSPNSFEEVASPSIDTSSSSAASPIPSVSSFNTSPPQFYLPSYLHTDVTTNYTRHLSWDVGHVTATVIDWVDQAGDYAHFHTLHSSFLIPYTKMPIPSWLMRLLPIGIKHDLKTYCGDDKEWKERVEATGVGIVDSHLIYFRDIAALTWAGTEIPNTRSETLELYIGPSIMTFHIPFSIGTFKVFVSSLPTEGGIIMRVKTYITHATNASIFAKSLAWLLTGISASQLASDIEILENKIKLRKPILQPFDGPYNRVNTWLKQFYNENSYSVSDKYKNDW